MSNYELTPTVHYADLIPESFTGTCCVCGKDITQDSFREQAVVAVVDFPDITCVCVGHLTGTLEEYDAAIVALAQTAAAKMRRRGRLI
jgi:hypothetical protein